MPTLKSAAVTWIRANSSRPFLPCVGPSRPPRGRSRSQPPWSRWPPLIYWTGNPRAANALLVEFRAAASLEPFRPTAAFLDALAHYRTATDRRQIQREASDVLAALLAMPEDSVVGPAGLLLRGQAYGELGFVGRMARSYERALPYARGSLAGRVDLFDSGRAGR